VLLLLLHLQLQSCTRLYFDAVADDDEDEEEDDDEDDVDDPGPSESMIDKKLDADVGLKAPTISSSSSSSSLNFFESFKTFYFSPF
jgi:hypothetical protein